MLSSSMIQGGFVVFQRLGFGQNNNLLVLVFFLGITFDDQYVVTQMHLDVVVILSRSTNLLML